MRQREREREREMLSNAANRCSDDQMLMIQDDAILSFLFRSRLRHVARLLIDHHHVPEMPELGPQPIVSYHVQG